MRHAVDILNTDILSLPFKQNNPRKWRTNPPAMAPCHGRSVYVCTSHALRKRSYSPRPKRHALPHGNARYLPSSCTFGKIQGARAAWKDVAGEPIISSNVNFFFFNLVAFSANNVPTFSSANFATFDQNSTDYQKAAT
jgi:hypothetical protein